MAASGSSVPNPKVASLRGQVLSELRILKVHWQLYDFSVVLGQKFLLSDSRNNGRNFWVATLAPRRPYDGRHLRDTGVRPPASHHLAKG